MTWESRLEKRPKYARLIGMVSIETANVDLFMGQLLARTLHVPLAIGEAIYLTPRAASARLDILETAAVMALDPPAGKRRSDDQAKKEKEALGRINRLIKRARALMLRRHEILHSAWGIAEKAKKVARVDLPRKEPGVGIHVSAREIASLIRDLRQLITDAQKLRDEFREHRRRWWTCA